MMQVGISALAQYVAQNFAAEIRNIGGDHTIVRARPFNRIGPGDLSFLNRKGIVRVDPTNLPQNCFLVLPRSEHADRVTTPCALVDTPRLVFGRLVEHFLTARPTAAIHETAVIHDGAEIGADVSIGPYCVVHPRTKIGAGTVLHSHVVVNSDVTVGEKCVLWSGCVIGEAGFGIETLEDGSTFRLPHIGGVEIGNGVHIGNSAGVSAGTLDPTVIEDFVQIDNLVQIGHNAWIGRGTLVAAGAVICGSVKLGENCWVGPCSSIMNGMKVGAGVRIGLGAFVHLPVKPKMTLMGHRAKSMPGFG